MREQRLAPLRIFTLNQKPVCAQSPYPSLLGGAAGLSIFWFNMLRFKTCSFTTISKVSSRLALQNKSIRTRGTFENVYALVFLNQRKIKQMEMRKKTYIGDGRKRGGIL